MSVPFTTGKGKIFLDGKEIGDLVSAEMQIEVAEPEPSPLPDAVFVGDTGLIHAEMKCEPIRVDSHNQFSAYFKESMDAFSYDMRLRMGIDVCNPTSHAVITGITTDCSGFSLPELTPIQWLDAEIGKTRMAAYV